jgi:hypothetical protein
MSEAIITPLRPKPKDPTGAQRQARFRKKRKAVVTVATATAAATPPPMPGAPQGIDLPTPPPLARRVTDMPALAARNGGTGIAVATLTAALSLAAVSGGFSIHGMTSIFTGALYPVIGMGAALELGKLSAVAWLGHCHASASWGLRLSLTMLVAVLMALNAVGCFGYLSKAHIASALAGDLAVAGRDADIEARLAMQAGVATDLDRRIAQIDGAVEKSTAKGRTNAAMQLAADQRRNRAELAVQRDQANRVFAQLKIEKAKIDRDRKVAEADLGPVRYLATLLGAGDQDVLRWFILVVAVLLDPAAVLLLLAATRR